MLEQPASLRLAMDVEIRSIMERLARERMQVEMRKIGRGATSANRKAAEIRAQRIKYGDLILTAAMLSTRDPTTFLDAMGATVRLGGSANSLEDPVSLCHADASIADGSASKVGNGAALDTGSSSSINGPTLPLSRRARRHHRFYLQKRQHQV